MLFFMTFPGNDYKDYLVGALKWYPIHYIFQASLAQIMELLRSLANATRNRSSDSKNTTTRVWRSFSALDLEMFGDRSKSVKRQEKVAR